MRVRNTDGGSLTAQAVLKQIENRSINCTRSRADSMVVRLRTASKMSDVLSKAQMADSR
jgi:hypothetical protein